MWHNKYTWILNGIKEKHSLQQMNNKKEGKRRAFGHKKCPECVLRVGNLRFFIALLCDSFPTKKDRNRKKIKRQYADDDDDESNSHTHTHISISWLWQ